MISNDIFVSSCRNPLTLENLESTLSASYDLRSQYIHNGLQINSLLRYYDADVGLPHHPHFKNKSINILSKAASFNALERIIRSALLKKLNLN